MITAEQVRAALTRRGDERGEHPGRAARGDGGFGPVRAAVRAASRPGARERSIDKVQAEFRGSLAEHDTRLLGIAVLVGILSGHTEEPVNLVNAPAMAAERGIELIELKDTFSSSQSS